MEKKIRGEIILIDDEVYEEDFLNTSLGELHYDVRIKFFNSAEKALQYLRETTEDIFLIICDFNMPGMNGLEMKKQIDADPVLKLKAIPFVFASANVSQEQIDASYSQNIQGFFKKPFSLEEMTELLGTIIRYWLVNIHPYKNKVVPDKDLA